MVAEMLTEDHCRWERRFRKGTRGRTSSSAVHGRIEQVVANRRLIRRLFWGSGEAGCEQFCDSHRTGELHGTAQPGTERRMLTPGKESEQFVNDPAAVDSTRTSNHRWTVDQADDDTAQRPAEVSEPAAQGTNKRRDRKSNVARSMTFFAVVARLGRGTARNDDAGTAFCRVRRSGSVPVCGPTLPRPRPSLSEPFCLSSDAATLSRKPDEVTPVRDSRSLASRAPLASLTRPTGAFAARAGSNVTIRAPPNEAGTAGVASKAAPASVPSALSRRAAENVVLHP
jgi:hypothetical protein